MTRLEIQDAPSKYVLSVAFFDSYQKKRRPVTFHTMTMRNALVVVRKDYQVIITGLDWEDGSGDSWLFRGYLPKENTLVTGWFRTTDRKGWMEIQD